jgi:hypothetical protein
MSIDLAEAFERHNKSYLKFEDIQSPAHPRPDICAFITIDRLLPNAGLDMVCAAERDQIYLDADCAALASVITDEDVLLLSRCGVMYDEEYDSLSMFA